MGMVDPMLQSEVGSQASLAELLPAHVALRLASLPVRRVEGVQAGEIRVLRQAGADPAWEEHHHLGLGLVLTLLRKFN